SKNNSPFCIRVLNDRFLWFAGLANQKENYHFPSLLLLLGSYLILNAMWQIYAHLPIQKFRTVCCFRSLNPLFVLIKEVVILYLENRLTGNFLKGYEYQLVHNLWYLKNRLSLVFALA